MVWAVGRWVAFVAAALFLYLRRREKRLSMSPFKGWYAAKVCYECDDLRAKLETATQACLDTLSRNEELCAKLADLRAKLVEREKRWAEQTVMRCDLEAKLAYAEKRGAAYIRDLGAEAIEATKRAEAAEARVKELEEREAERRSGAIDAILKLDL
jgi:hypothetical protein